MPKVLTEQPLWRDDDSIAVELREDIIRTLEGSDSSQIIRQLLDEFFRKQSNRTRYLKNEVEQVSGSSGSINNLPDVDPTNRVIGSVLTFNGSKVIYEIPDTGFSVLTQGTNILPEEMSDDERTFENGLGSWQNEQGAALTQTSVIARSGSNALRVESTSTGDVIFTTATGSSGVPVQAGTVKVISGWLQNQSTSRVFNISIRWYNASGTFISESFSSDVSANNAQFFEATFEATAPLDTDNSDNSAAFYAIAFTIKDVTTTGEFHYIDDVSVKGKLVTRKFLDLLNTDVTDDPANNAIQLGSIANTFRVISSDVTAQTSDNTALYLLDASSQDITITLPNNFPNDYHLRLRRFDNSDNVITLEAEGSFDPNGVTPSLDVKFAGVEVFHKGANEWVVLPFSGGALGEIRTANPDGSAPSDLGVWLPFDGTYHDKASYPTFKPALIPDGTMPWLEAQNWEFVPHDDDTADGQVDYQLSNVYTGTYSRNEAAITQVFYSPLDKTFLATCLDISEWDYPFWLVSEDDGDTWSRRPLGLPEPTGSQVDSSDPNDRIHRYKFGMIGATLFAWNFYDSVLQRSSDFAQTWEDISTNPGVPDLASSDSLNGIGYGGASVFKGTPELMGLYAEVNGNYQILYSTDLGDSWINGTNPPCFSGYWNTDLLFFANGLFIAINNNATHPNMHYSTDLETWTEVPSDVCFSSLNQKSSYTGFIFDVLGMCYNDHHKAVFFLLEDSSPTDAEYLYVMRIDMPSWGVVSEITIMDKNQSLYQAGWVNLTALEDKIIITSSEYDSVNLPQVYTGSNAFDIQSCMTSETYISPHQDAELNLPMLIASHDLANDNTVSQTTKRIYGDLDGNNFESAYRSANQFIVTDKYLYYFGFGKQFSPDVGNIKNSLVARCPHFGYDPDTQFYLPDWKSQAYVKVAY